MMKTGLVSFFLVLFLSGSMSSAGQSVISSAGASASGGGVQLSWTVGEPVIATLAAGGHILTQGFHQSKLTITALEPIAFPGLELTVYPNPVSSTLRLDITGERPEELFLSLFNMEGKALLTRPVEALPELINMELYTPGSYLLKVYRGQGQSLGTFTIVKR